MGADLVLHMLEMPKNKEPNWEAADAHVMRLSDAEICEVAERYPGDDDNNDTDEEQGESEERDEGEEGGHARDEDDRDGKGQSGDDGDEDSEVTESKRRLHGALESVRACWDGEFRNAVRLKGVHTAIMVVGGTSFGDPFSEIDDVDLFIVSGMATAAGFILP